MRAADVKAAADHDDAGEEDEDSGRLRRISGGSAGSLDEDDGEEEGEEEEEERSCACRRGQQGRISSGASREGGGAAESRADVAVRRSITQWSDDSTKHEWDRFSRTRRMAKVAEEKQQPMDRSVSFKQKSPTSNDRLQTVMERSASFPSLVSLDGEINMMPPEAAPSSSSVLELAAADAVAAVDGSRSSRRSFSSGDWSDDQQKQSSLPSYLDDEHEETSPIILRSR